MMATDMQRVLEADRSLVEEEAVAEKGLQKKVNSAGLFGTDNPARIAGKDGRTGTVDTASAYPFQGEEEEENLDEYEMVDPEFFAQVKEPAFTVNVNKTSINSACVRMFPDVDFVKYMINQKKKRLMVKPCSEYDIRGYRWVKEKNGRRYAAQRTGAIFVMIICSIMGWDPDCRYQIPGRRVRANGEEVLVFDLSVKKSFPKNKGEAKSAEERRTAIPAGWNGRFGPTYAEDKRSLQTHTFDGYTVFSVSAGQKKTRRTKDGHLSVHVQELEKEAAEAIAELNRADEKNAGQTQLEMTFDDAGLLKEVSEQEMISAAQDNGSVSKSETADASSATMERTPSGAGDMVSAEQDGGRSLMQNPARKPDVQMPEEKLDAQEVALESGVTETAGAQNENINADRETREPGTSIYPQEGPAT